MQDYVVVFPVAMDLVNKQEEVLVIKKQRPAWQKDKFNLLGGHVESGEDPIQTAVRELKEESGYLPLQDDEHQDKMPHTRLLGRIFGNWGNVYCFRINVYKYPQPERRAEEDEPVSWEKWNNIKENPSLIANLKIIIPLMMNEIHGWAIEDNLGEDMKISFVGDK